MSKKPILSQLLVGTALLLFAVTIVNWLFHIDLVVYFNALTVKIYQVSSTALAVAGFALMVWRRNPRLKYTPLHWLKVAGGTWVLSLLLGVVVLSYLTYWSSTLPASYVATYEYAAHGKRSCTGATVYDQEVAKNVRVCHPGALREGGEIRVEKLSGPMGIVVQQGHLL